MPICVRIDESGDPASPEGFVVAGVIFPNQKELDSFNQKYVALEKRLRPNALPTSELKGVRVDDQKRHEILKVLKRYHTFALIIRMQGLAISAKVNRKLLSIYRHWATMQCVSRLLFADPMGLKGNEGIEMGFDNLNLNSTQAGELKNLLIQTLNAEIKALESPKPFKKIHISKSTCFDSKKEPGVRAADILAHSLLQYIRNSKKGHIELNAFEQIWCYPEVVCVFSRDEKRCPLGNPLLVPESLRFAPHKPLEEEGSFVIGKPMVVKRSSANKARIHPLKVVYGGPMELDFELAPSQLSLSLPKRARQNGLRVEPNPSVHEQLSMFP